jgi:hypothetical protein
VATAPLAHVARGLAVLNGLSYPWPRLGFPILFLPGRRGMLGTTFVEERRIEIYVRPEEGPAELAHVIAHEIGHAVDLTYGTQARRDEWMRLRGLDPTSGWWGCPGCADYATPSGDFAEVFSSWVNGSWSEFRSRLAGPPAPADLQALSVFFWP